MIPRVHIGSGELLAVPAVHNRSVFAELMNRACRDDATRPEAIAVELSQDSVDAVVKWFKELGVGPSGNGKIPCMLGLAKSNRRIHPRHKQAALRLQELHGRPLHEIAPEVLRRELKFSPVSLLCLSTTDSIIEGVRSAVELNLPVYGIDLGETANAERGQPMIQDPMLAQENLADFVARNDAVCFLHRDTVVDERREQVMAARLKRLLCEYQRVLFTGGIGHWHTLRQRLAEPSVVAAANPSTTEGEQYRRVVVAPSMAVFQMDVLPALTKHYESIRSLPPDARERRLDFMRICRASLAEACAKAETRNQDLLPAFCQYLSNVSLLNQCRTPDLFSILSAAREMISVSFTERVGEILVNEAVEWARKDQWPDLPYLRGVQEPRDSASAGLQAEVEDHGRTSDPFYITHHAESTRPNQEWPLPYLPDPGQNADGNDRHRCTSYSWVWPPCETLLYGTAYAAAEILDRKSRERCPEPFTGSLHDGVDVKATLRAVIRGEQRVQVKAPAALAQRSILTEASDEPTVFIFERATEARDGRWQTLTAGGSEDIRKFVENRWRFDAITNRKGHAFVACVQYCADREPDQRLKDHLRGYNYLYGITVFANPSLNPIQSARWLESCDYTGCPIIRYGGTSDLFEYYQREHKLSLNRGGWIESLIRAALPFAKQRVTVLLPKSETIEPRVSRDAAARGISLECMPLTRFSKERIETIRNQYLVRPLDVNRLEYPEEIQAAFGESPRKNLELLPERIRAQLELPH